MKNGVILLFEQALTILRNGRFEETIELRADCERMKDMFSRNARLWSKVFRTRNGANI